MINFIDCDDVSYFYIPNKNPKIQETKKKKVKKTKNI